MNNMQRENEFTTMQSALAGLGAFVGAYLSWWGGSEVAENSEPAASIMFSSMFGVIGGVFGGVGGLSLYELYRSVRHQIITQTHDDDIINEEKSINSPSSPSNV